MQYLQEKDLRSQHHITSNQNQWKILYAKIMEVNKITKMYQVMVVVNYKMGNLGLQISTLTNRLLSAKQENQELQKSRKKGVKAQAILKNVVSTWQKKHLNLR